MGSRFVRIGVLAACLALLAAAQANALTVRGGRLFDGRRAVRLLGVNVSGTEDQCAQGDFITAHYGTGRYFTTPLTQQTVNAMKAWHINAVRVPLNESCWLGHAVARAGAPYRAAMSAWVKLLLHNHLYVIVTALNATAGTDDAGRPQPAEEVLPMLDAAEGVPFWRSVAETFKRDRNVLFDLYNEPHDVSWSCWKDGCEVPAGEVPGSNGEPGGVLHYPAYLAVGMDQLVRTVRATGARQPLLLGGLGYAGDLSSWLAYRPADGELIASVHVYGPKLAPCDAACRATLRTIRSHGFPVVTGELGETDCSHAYIDNYMSWADQNDISYLGWSWNDYGHQRCGNVGPVLIRDLKGDPTVFGAGLRNHLRRINRTAYTPPRSDYPFATH